MVIGSKGSLVILLRNPYQENAIKDTLRWGRESELQSRSVHRRPIRADAGLESSEFKAESIAIMVGGISMHGYDVKGLNVTRGRCVSPAAQQERHRFTGQQAHLFEVTVSS